MVLNFRRIFGTSRPREERSSAMVLTVTEDTPADMLAGSMELLVQMPRDHHVQTQRVTVQRSTPMMDLLVQIATAHKLAASSYTLQAIGERGLVLPHQPNTPIGALDALQVKLLPKQGTFLPRKSRQTNQPFETTFRLQVHLPRNQLYVSRVSPKTNLGEILDEVCREKNLDRNKYELRHPANLAETLDPELTLQDYHLQEVTLCPRQQGRALIGSALSSQDIMALQKQEECRRQQARNNHHHNHHHSTSVFGFMFKKSKESSLSTDSLGNRSVSPARSDETARSSSPIQQQQQMQGEVQMRKEHPPPPPARPLRKRRPAPKPPIQQPQQQQTTTATPTTKTVSRTLSKSASESGSTTTTTAPDKDKIVISHSRNSSDSSGYHEASVLSDNPDNGAGGNGRMPETLPRRGKMQGILESPRKLAHTSQASKSLGNLAIASSHGGTLSRGVSNTSLSSAGQRKKRAAPPPPMARPLPSAISAQGLERIVDSDESLTSDMDLSKPSSDIDVGATGPTGSSSKASSDIGCNSHVRPIAEQPEHAIDNGDVDMDDDHEHNRARVEPARVVKKGKAIPTDTDILLQKVSDTLSHSLPSPPSPPPTPEDASLEPPNLNPATTVHHSAADPPRVINSVAATSTTGDNCANEKSAKSDAQISRTTLSLPESNKPQHQQQQQQHKSEPDEYERLVVTSSADGSANNSASQQDTSDYVSANGEDLSIGDWEYQIPAPPSAFRDDDNDSVNNVPAPAPIRVTTTTISNAAVSAKAVVEHAAVKPIKEPISIEAEIHYRAPEKHAKPSTLTVELTKQSSPHPKPTRQSEPEHQSAKIDSTVDSVDFCQPQKPTPKLSSPQLSNEATELKKAEVINELETKIQSNRPIVEPVTTRDESYAPKIAPVENNLSNFTITTYSRQKSLDIFEQIDQQQQQLHNDNRVLNTFATLTRGRSTAADYADEKVTRNGRLKNAQSMERMSVPLVDDKAKFAERNDMPREKATVHRSKSYIILSSNEKFQNRANEMDKSRDERKVDDRFAYDSSDSTKKYTSLANVNASTNEEIPRHKEKFSQWRDNILRKQEEPTKEKQLQSLQVLKSILPQLKNAQATEENGYKSTSDNFTTKKRQESQHEHKPPRDSSPISTNATSTTTTTATSTEVQMRANRRDHEPAKRYTYSGPPAISLGSWSERPCVNVQIKTDTDYKFGGRSNKSGNNNNSSSASGARTVVSLNGGETHNSVRTQNGGIVESVHTKVATTPVEIEKEDESRVDTTSVNFRELTKAFGQADVRLRPKPPATPARNPHNRLSEYIERPKPEIVPKQNGFADSHVVSTTSFGVSHNRANPPAPPIRRYTSVVGIMNNNNIISNKNGISSQPTNFRFVNGQTKTFNGQKERDYAVPKPPTMPIITGVTLKSVSARPKSSPATIQADPRDQLLESIRNFGGREKLKSAAERY